MTAARTPQPFAAPRLPGAIGVVRPDRASCRDRHHAAPAHPTRATFAEARR